MSESLVELRGVTKRYGAVEVLKRIDLSVGRNEFLVILGPSGSGKTTILRMIGGFTRPTDGEIFLDGNQPLSDIPINRRPFNTVFQDYALFPHMTVAKNIGFGLKVGGVPGKEIDRETNRVLSLVELDGLGSRYPSELSGGQCQRVALARAIVCKPRLVLLDEPLAALDASLRHQMQRFLKELQREVGVSFLFITHDQEEAITMADRIVVMDHGHIRQVATPRELYYRPADRYVAQFFGDNNLIPGVVADALNSDVLLDTPFCQCRVAVPSGHSFRKGDAVNLAVRPEAIKVIPATGGPACGHVEQIEFVGSTTAFKIRSCRDSNVSIEAKSLSGVNGAGIRPGAKVGVSWADCEAWVIKQ